MELKTLKEIQAEVAKKYGLGSSLVMGHRALYFDEATKEYAAQAVRMALEEAAKNVTVEIFTAEYGAYSGHEIDKSSILSLADEIIGKLK